MKKVLICGAALAAMLSGSVLAEKATSEKQASSAIEFRQALFQLIRSNVGPLGAMAKGRIPIDAEVLKTNGLRLEQLSMMVPDYLKLDTSDFDIDNSAEPKIWTNVADFNSKANDLTMAATNLQKVAIAGDEGEYKKAIGGVLKTCKGCHDSYKTD